MFVFLLLLLLLLCEDTLALMVSAVQSFSH